MLISALLQAYTDESPVSSCFQVTKKVIIWHCVQKAPIHKGSIQLKNQEHINFILLASYTFLYYPLWDTIAQVKWSERTEHRSTVD